MGLTKFNPLDKVSGFTLPKTLCTPTSPASICLTAEVNKSIMEYIEEIRAFEKKYLSFTKNNKEYNINLDASFFSNE